MNDSPILDLRVERPVVGGAMLAHHDGRVVLVQGAIPGERVRARVVRERRDVLHATVVDVEEADPDRRRMVGDPSCGGQVYRHIAYPRQCQLKSQVIADALRRIAHFEGTRSIPVRPSTEYGYRMRARLHPGGPGLGFLREGTHAVCDAAQTGQLLEATTQVVAEVGRRLGQSNDRSVLHVDIAENISADERVLHFHLCQRRAPATIAAWSAECELSGVTCSTRGKGGSEVLSGTPTVGDLVAVLTQTAGTGGVQLRRQARSFFQGNRYLLPALVGAVCRRVTAGPVVDLYAGVGLFAVALASRGVEPITAVERDAFAAEDLEANTIDASPSIEVVRAPVEQFLSRRSDVMSGTVIVDPPRTGLTRTVVERLAQRRAAHLVYVACDVATFARDVRRLIEAGYLVEAIEAFDMFPNTAHVELLATLRR